MKPVIVHQAARAELDDAVAFYQRRAPGLGHDLLDKVARAFRDIQQFPEAWPPHRKVFRKYFVVRFPFTIFYVDLPGHIWVVAIAHGSRRPDYWKGRRRDE